MATRAQLQAKRNIAVVKQRQAREKHTAGSTEHLAAMAETRRLGGLMEDRVRDFGDRTSAGNIVTVHNVGDYVDSEGGLLKKASAPSSVSHLASGGGGGGGGSGGGGSVMSIPSTFKRTRGGYDPDTSVDMTNTNPAYWNSAIAYFKANPDGNPKTGELGIWIPNFEKQGAESVALAFIAGGGTAHVNSNYANNTVSDVRGARAIDGAPGTRRATASLTGLGSKSYTGGAEKAIRLNSISRGGTDVTGPGIGPMGTTNPIGYGAHILGGEVVKAAGSGYLDAGGDYGGLLGEGTKITGSMLTGLLGGMDKDGMRLRGTMPAVMGATGSGIGAGGTKTGIGGFYGSGVDPLATMPKVSDYTAYMDPNSIFGGLSENAAVKSGLLYQPMASDYGAKMEAAGLPAFSPGLLGSFTSAGGPTYGSPVSGFTKPKAGGATPGSGTVPIGSPAGKYAYPETMFGYKTSLFPKYHSYDVLSGVSDGYTTGTGPWSYMTKGGTPAAIVGPSVYTWHGGGGDGGWSVHDTYDPVKAT